MATDIWTSKKRTHGQANIYNGMMAWGADSAHSADKTDNAGVQSGRHWADGPSPGGDLMVPGDPRTGARYRALKTWAKGYFPWTCVYCRLVIPTTRIQDRWQCTLAHNVAVSVRPDLALDKANILGLAHRGCNRTDYALSVNHPERRRGTARPQTRRW